jgi:nicotinamide riboside kinase
VSAVQNQQFDHYFLCKPDIPWEPDELRESEHERDQLFAIYEQMIIELGWNYTIVCGDLNTRKTKIRNVLNNISSIANH